jgi:hypothetical protein
MKDLLETVEDEKFISFSGVKDLIEDSSFIFSYLREQGDEHDELRREAVRMITRFKNNTITLVPYPSKLLIKRNAPNLIFLYTKLGLAADDSAARSLLLNWDIFYNSENKTYKPITDSGKILFKKNQLNTYLMPDNTFVILGDADNKHESVLVYQYNKSLECKHAPESKYHQPSSVLYMPHFQFIYRHLGSKIKIGNTVVYSYNIIMDKNTPLFTSEDVINHISKIPTDSPAMERFEKLIYNLNRDKLHNLVKETPEERKKLLKALFELAEKKPFVVTTAPKKVGNYSYTAMTIKMNNMFRIVFVNNEEELERQILIYRNKLVKQLYDYIKPLKDTYVEIENTNFEVKLSEFLDTRNDKVQAKINKGLMSKDISEEEMYAGFLFYE